MQCIKPTTYFWIPQENITFFRGNKSDLSKKQQSYNDKISDVLSVIKLRATTLMESCLVTHRNQSWRGITPPLILQEEKTSAVCQRPASLASRESGS